jgi:hypothetical protein
MIGVTRIAKVFEVDVTEELEPLNTEFDRLATLVTGGMKTKMDNKKLTNFV